MVKNILRLPFWQIKSGFVSPSTAENSEPKRQKLSNESTTEAAIDMISDLPELVLFHILSFLPTNDAVATSILSTKWRFLWTKMTIFNFDDGLFPAGGSGPSGRRNRRLDAGKREIFVNFVDRVFLVSAATFMKKLSLKCGKRCGQNHINNWIRTAIGRGVEELDLTTYGHGLDYRLPGSSLFICKTLVALNLSGDVMINETSSGSFPNLKILYLTSVKYQSDDSVRKFISSCLVLEQLTVVRDRDDNVVTFTISAPTLKHLTIDFRSCSDDSDRALKINAPVLQCLNLFDDLSINFMVEDLTSLVEAKVDVFNKKMLMYNEGYRDSVIGFLMSLHNAKILCLRYHSVEVLSYYWISTRFQNLIRLVLQSRYCDWIALEDLLQQAENLETFHVNARFMHWREPEQVPKCVSSTLTRIFLGSFGCVKNERTMVKYFLNNAKVLKSMEILTYNVDELKKENTLQKILRFQRASQVMLLSSERCFLEQCQSLGISMEIRSRDASDLEKYYRTVQKILRFPGTSQACEFQFSRDFANWDRMQGEIYYTMDEQNLYDNLLWGASNSTLPVLTYLEILWMDYFVILDFHCSMASDFAKTFFFF